MTVSISFNGGKITDKLDLLTQTQLPWIAALTLSGKHKDDVSIATELKKDLIFEMEDSFRQVGSETRKLFHTKATKKTLFTEVSHKSDAAKGQAPSEYLKPQILGGPVLLTQFQRRLMREGYIKSSSYMLPLQDVSGFRRKNGRLAPSVYTQALWGISAMEDLRSSRHYGKNKTSSFKTKGSFVHVPRNATKNLGGESMKQYVQNLRALNYKKGDSWTGSLPKAGIYKVTAKGLKQVFQELDSIPKATKDTYLFNYASDLSVKKHAARIFRMKVKEVIGK